MMEDILYNRTQLSYLVFIFFSHLVLLLTEFWYIVALLVERQSVQDCNLEVIVARLRKRCWINVWNKTVFNLELQLVLRCPVICACESNDTHMFCCIADLLRTGELTVVYKKILTRQ